MSNPVSQIAEAVVTALTAGLVNGLTNGLANGITPYAPAPTIQAGLFRPAQLPAFDRYAIIVTPGARPYSEKRLTVMTVQPIVRLDLFVLVKNWEQTSTPLFGQTAPDRGLFELVQSLKDVLRLSTLGGLLDKTYDEPGGDAASPGLGGGDIDFQDTIQGFDAHEHAFVHRARVPFVGRAQSICHPRVGG